MSSGAGIGRPLAAATSWYSVQDSEKSLRPLQKGANRRSICYNVSVWGYAKVVHSSEYHQLPDDDFVEVFRSRIRSQRY